VETAVELDEERGIGTDCCNVGIRCGVEKV
jgi:hypothetical protein